MLLIWSLKNLTHICLPYLIGLNHLKSNQWYYSVFRTVRALSSSNSSVSMAVPIVSKVSILVISIKWKWFNQINRLDLNSDLPISTAPNLIYRIDIRHRVFNSLKGYKLEISQDSEHEYTHVWTYKDFYLWHF